MFGLWLHRVMVSQGKCRGGKREQTLGEKVAGDGRWTTTVGGRRRATRTNKEDDVKYKLDERVVSDTHALKDIGVDYGVTFMTKEVSVDVHDELSGMQNKCDEDNNEKKQLPSSSKPVGDTVVPKQKTKEQEPHGFQAKQAKPNATTRWIPSNKGSYQDSMHVSYPMIQRKTCKVVRVHEIDPKY